MKPNSTPANPRKPAHEIRLNGVRASNWKNDTDQGPRCNTTFERSYRDGKEWKSSNSFGLDDLPTLGFVAQEVLHWIIQQRQEQPAASKRG
jgi:hypothetical protein